MLPAKANFTESSSDSQERYAVFLSVFNHGNLKIHFDPARPPLIEPGRITFYLQIGTPPSVIKHLESAALAPKVRAALERAWSQTGLLQTRPEVAYVTTSAPTYWPAENELLLDEGDEDPDEYQGVYRDTEAAIIQSDKTEWSATQYFRKKWRPLLGPTLSELVRELRQRCHVSSRRNKFETTYKGLALALGVSEATIKRALQRDKAGNFKNEYLQYFIADIQTIREVDANGHIRTKGSRFLIYLTDTLTPADRDKSTERSI